MPAPSPSSVFINCPFDPEYLELFRPLVFTILSLGLKPRFSLERADSGEIRIRKIIGLIQESSLGIHDLSRCTARKKGEFYRMNMPLELGYDLGAKAFGGRKYRSKKVLILQQHPYTVQRVVSDLAGCDCRAHENDPRKIVALVRDWLVQEAAAPETGSTSIWYAFNDFMAWNYDNLKALKWTEQDISNMEMNEIKTRMGRWLNENPIP